jgi:hypothetical protein
MQVDHDILDQIDPRLGIVGIRIRQSLGAGMNSEGTVTSEGREKGQQAASAS